GGGPLAAGERRRVRAAVAASAPGLRFGEDDDLLAVARLVAAEPHLHADLEVGAGDGLLAGGDLALLAAADVVQGAGGVLDCEVVVVGADLGDLAGHLARLVVLVGPAAAAVARLVPGHADAHPGLEVL